MDMFARPATIAAALRPHPDARIPSGAASSGARHVRACLADAVKFTFDAELWIWDARRADSWTFVSLPPEASADIRELVDATPQHGFGSVRVRVTLGNSTWTTSVFPDSTRGSYSLPVKKAVRTAEALDAGDVATVTVELADF